MGGDSLPHAEAREGSRGRISCPGAARGGQSALPDQADSRGRAWMPQVPPGGGEQEVRSRAWEGRLWCYRL